MRGFIHEQTGTPLFTDNTIFELSRMLSMAEKENKQESIFKIQNDIRKIVINQKITDGMIALFTAMQACGWMLTKTDKEKHYTEEKEFELATKIFDPIVLSVIDQIVEKKSFDDDTAHKLYEKIGDLFEGQKLYVIVPSLALAIYSVFNHFDIRKEKGDDFIMYQ